MEESDGNCRDAGSSEVLSRADYFGLIRFTQDLSLEGRAFIYLSAARGGRA